MENLTCVFCGHRDAPESLYKMVYHTAEELIVRQSVTQFYCGGKGAFDRIAARAVYNLKIRYPHIRSCQVLAYLPKKFDSASDDLFDETIYPEGLETVPLRLAYLRRNRWMVEQADFLIAYVKFPGGAKTMLEYAKRKNRIQIRNLAEKLP